MATDQNFPPLDLKNLSASDLSKDAVAAAIVTFMAIPQGVAYAMIAGLPPAVGLYAGALPTILGSFFRSSRHVVTGPTNALSLLVGGAVASQAEDPVAAAMLLAFLVGVIQLLAGVLRLGILVDFISAPVVVGYITGAGILIGVGQLPNLTNTAGGSGDVITKLLTWASGLADANVASVGLGVVVAIAIIALRLWRKQFPAPLFVLTLATAATWAFSLDQYGIKRIVDLSPVPTGLPPFTIPSFDGWWDLLPVAIAGTVLSLVESSAVARAIATRTGQRLVMQWEFIGQGLANIAAAFTGAYPTSGSLSRSALNERVGGTTRLSGVMTGIFMLLVLLVLGPVVNYTPITALAGLLLVVAWDLVDKPRIRRIMTATWTDAVAFVATVIGTWALSLDKAIYLGVGISLVLFLRRARMLVIHRMAPDETGRLQELPEGETGGCTDIQILHVEGQLFFGAAGELAQALEDVVAEGAKVVIVRLKRTQGLDFTAAQALQGIGERLSSEGRHLVLVGMRPDAMKVLEGADVVDALGDDHVFPTHDRWFGAMEEAMQAAVVLADAEGDCPIRRYVRGRQPVVGIVAS